MKLPEKIEGNIFIDERGYITYNNNFRLDQFKRFYIVESHIRGQIRAWHGHEFEIKGAMVLQGAVRLCTTKLTEFNNPSIDSKIDSFCLSNIKNEIVVIPGGYANGFQALTDNAKIMFFSSSTISESQGDDYRYPFDYWNPWEIANY
jgi:dTDP-4-dehydrorhamnose 3,5-epimerase-like enzyme